MNIPKPSILLVDDDAASIGRLSARLGGILGDSADLVVWNPAPEDGDPREAFFRRISECTALVVTDYDLTTSVRGLFGLSIVGWCQSLAIPVGDFSRANLDALPSEPSLFELRVPTDEEQAASFIEKTFHGFQFIRNRMKANSEILAESRSMAEVLARLLESPHSESQFAAYMTKLGASNSALLQIIRDFADEKAPSDDEKIDFLTYALGHVLANAVLKYPGPIISLDVLCAYAATATDEGEKLAPLFENAKYNGPFSHNTQFFWREKIDSNIDEMSDGIDDGDLDSFAEYSRRVVERSLGRKLAPHACERCKGLKGGFRCPYTSRAVCERGDCSVPASSWIPSGTRLCRAEKDFYDEWAPILGY